MGKDAVKVARSSPGSRCAIAALPGVVVVRGVHVTFTLLFLGLACA